MERFLEQYDKESMKMAVLKHEEIFKEQVTWSLVLKINQEYFVAFVSISSIKAMSLCMCTRFDDHNVELLGT